ncbi:hypothetical protein [Paenibacillus polymyxa]|uniref:hypothetical protein n=1 Tax=Paenibacillus polymyxa TaxID=1406 RepID=UPI00234B294A|nr:hypothetical protein [Paenibacillus polymyxa]WCM60039.1 hypothetical protein OYT09_18830 [Paenibacillus polymyxa]
MDHILKSKYREDAAKPIGNLTGENRFGKASTTSLTSFVNELKDMITNAGLPKHRSCAGDLT